MSGGNERLNEALVETLRDENVSPQVRFKKAQYLIALGADVNTHLYGKSVLSWSIDENIGEEIEEFLKKKGAKEWVISKEEAERLGQKLILAINSDEEEKNKKVKELLKEGADVNAITGFEYENTALIEACRYGYVEVAKELIKVGADVHQKNINGQTALMWACFCGNIEIMKELIKKGVNVNAQTTRGETALLEASCKRWIEGVEMLLQNGADVDIEGEICGTALQAASNLGYNDIVKVLEEHIKKKNDEKIKVSNSKGFGSRLLRG